MNNDKNLYPLIISFILHLFFIYVIIFGFPHFFKPLPVENIVVSLEVLPISNEANIKTKKAQKEQKLNAENAKKVDKSKTDKKQKIKDNAEKVTKKEVNDNSTEEVSADTPKEKVTNTEQDKKQKEKLIEEIALKKKEPSKPKIITNTKEKRKKLNNNNELDSLLKTLEQSSEEKGKANTHNKARSDSNDIDKEAQGIFDENQPEVINHSALIKKQIEEKWDIPSGTLGKAFSLKYVIKYDNDAQCIDYKLVDKNCSELDTRTCQTLIINCERAIKAASPLKGVDPAFYNEWNEINYTFTPKKF